MEIDELQMESNQFDRTMNLSYQLQPSARTDIGMIVFTLDDWTILITVWMYLNEEGNLYTSTDIQENCSFDEKEIKILQQKAIKAFSKRQDFIKRHIEFFDVVKKIKLGELSKDDVKDKYPI